MRDWTSEMFLLAYRQEIIAGRMAYKCNKKMPISVERQVGLFDRDCGTQSLEQIKTNLRFIL